MNRPTPDEIRSIYAGIESLGLSDDIQGWNSDGPIFEELIARVRPTAIIEVGSWKGKATIHMANLCRKRHIDTIIYAVDLWVPTIGVGLGEIPRTQIPDRFDAPSFYHQFLSNIRNAGCDDCVIPVRGLTTCVASLLDAWDAKAYLVYVDASHDEESAYRDCVAYWPLVKLGGIMFGDDYSSHPGVKRAVDRFAREVNRRVTEVPGQENTQWLIDPK